jgi:putative hemolysin
LILNDGFMAIQSSCVYLCFVAFSFGFSALEVHASSTLNPASQSCLDAGGSLRMGGSSHSNRLLCKLPSGLVCERWALRRGECGSKIAQTASSIDATFKPASLRTQ